MTVGEVAWEVTEEPDWRVTSSGRRKLSWEDISVSWGEPVEREHRAVPLGGGFWLVRPATPGRGPSELGGFGLTLRNEEQWVFSWEWFVCRDDGRARKHEEEGELAYTAIGNPDGCTIIRTEFLTDVSLRAIPAESMKLMGPPRSPRHHPKWRIRILAGSYVNWTSDAWS